MRTALRCGVALLAVAAAGCTTWKVQTAPVRDAVAAPVPKARVTLRDGSRMQLWSPRVEGDSLVGRLSDDTARTAFAVADVAAVELREPSAVETVKMTAIIALGIAVVWFRLALGDS